MEPTQAERTVNEYRQRIAQLDQLAAELGAQDKWFSRARGVVFLVSLFLAFLAWDLPPWRSFLLGAAVAVFVGFIAVIWLHERLLDRIAIARMRRTLQRQQLARLQREWSKLPPPQVDVPPQHASVAGDLDLMGVGSLYQWLCRAHTPKGRRQLRDWLLCPADPEEIETRQEAVRYLATDRQLRDDFELHGRLLSASDTGPSAFIRWAEGPLQYAQRHLLRWVTRLLTVAMIALPVALFLEWLPPPWWLAVLGLVAVNVLVNAVFVGAIHDLFNQITAGKNELAHYTALFETVASLPPEAQRLRELSVKLDVGEISFREALARLQRIMLLGSGRRSSVFGVLYVFVQLLWLWDFHVVGWLEHWQARFGGSVRRWFDAVAELEALCSLAAAAADHPAWTYPQVRCGSDTLEATGLGHPLLKPSSCQPNDVRLGPPGTFLLVTGSNMSGKSTLLRSLGVNAVLAQAGAPVCAAAWQMPTVDLATSMRVTDSLSEGVSFFFAELKRLKEVVDHAHEVDPASGRRLLFLLDEILQGTNSAERHIAVAKVVDHLLSAPTIGAVSTHDLELASEPELKQRCQTVHFREQFHNVDGRREMSFDYQLRDGVSPTTNALKLLELVGLGESTENRPM